MSTARAPAIRLADSVVIERCAPVVSGGAHADGFLVTMRSGPDAAEQDVAWVYADRAQLDRAEPVGEWRTLGMRATESMVRSWPERSAHQVLTGDVARECMVPLSHLGWPPRADAGPSGSRGGRNGGG